MTKYVLCWEKTKLKSSLSVGSIFVLSMILATTYSLSLGYFSDKISIFYSSNNIFFNLIFILGIIAGYFVCVFIPILLEYIFVFIKGFKITKLK